jgi:hypothetical protein
VDDARISYYLGDGRSKSTTCVLESTSLSGSLSEERECGLQAGGSFSLRAIVEAGGSLT